MFHLKIVTFVSRIYILFTVNLVCVRLGLEGDEDVKISLLGRKAVWTCWMMWMFRMNILLPYSGLKECCGRWYLVVQCYANLPAPLLPTPLAILRRQDINEADDTV